MMLLLWGCIWFALGSLPEVRAEKRAEREPAQLTIIVENDAWLGTDRYYTHGMQLRYHNPLDKTAPWMDSLLDKGTLGLSVEHRRWGVLVGQQMYTPENIGFARPQPFDRPWAGWLYGGFILQRKGTEFKGQIPVQDHFEINFGVIGPESYADDVQTWWHRIHGYQTPRGWANQLKFEPGILLSADRAYRLATPTDKTWWQMDLIPHAGMTVGNIMTCGTLGVELRAGYNLPGDVGPGHVDSPIRASMVAPAEPGRAERRHPEFGMYVFAGVDGRAVAQNIFLDGNSFRNGPSVDKKPLVADLKVGVACQIYRLSLSGAYITRTREFELQRSEQQFASIAATFSF